MVVGSVLRAGRASVDKAMVYRQVARLHAENINQGFLSSLGPRFLALLYQAVDEIPSGALIVARENDQVVGFVSGTVGMGSVYRQLLRQGQRLMVALTPSLLKPNRLWRIELDRRAARGYAARQPKVPRAMEGGRIGSALRLRWKPR
jgi:hypothetical protein